MKYKILIGLLAILIIPLVLADSSVNIQPDNPYTTNNLNCTAAGATEGYIFKWFVNGLESEINSHYVDSSATKHYEIWRCYVEQYIPFVGHIPIGEDSVTVLNSAPVLNQISDIEKNEGELVEIIPAASDLDNDALTYIYTSPLNSSGQWQTDYLSAGTYTVTVTVSDSNQTDSQNVQIEINNVNRLPNITSVAAPNGSEGNTLDFSFTAEDLDNDDTLTYTIKRNTSIVSNTNSYSWTTDYDDAGDYTFEFIVSDGIASDTETRTISISNTNRAPNITNIIAPETAMETNYISFLFTASDIDNDPISYQILRNGTVVSNISSYNWQTGLNDAGVYNFTFTASDGLLQSSESRILTIANYNQAPVIDTITAQSSVVGGQWLNLSFNATDADNDSLTYQILRNGTEVSSASTYSLLTSSADKGTYNYTFIVSDGTLEDSDSRIITITNDAPVIINITYPISVNETDWLNVSFTASDANNDTLTHRILIGGVNVTNTQSYSWLTDYDDAGTYNFTFEVSDGASAVSESKLITVNNVNRAPAITVDTEPQEGYFYHGESVNLYFEAEDPDEDEITFQILQEGIVVSDTNTYPWTATEGIHNFTFIASDGELNDTSNHAFLVIYAATGNVVINEFMPNPISGSDWIEIYNNDTIPVNISGWIIEDDAGNSQALSGILEENEFQQISFSNYLNADHDVIYLYDSAVDLRDFTSYNYNPGMDVSVGRFPDGSDEWYNLTNPTPGSANIYGSWIEKSWIDSIYYNEGAYRTVDNILGSTINLSTITGPTIYVIISDIFNSDIVNSSIVSSTIDNCTILDSDLSDTYCKDAYIDPSNTTGSTVIDSTITNSNATYSNITDSQIEDSDVNNSEIYDSEIENADIYESFVSENSWIVGAELSEASITNSTVGYTQVGDSNISDSKISYSEVYNSDISNSNVYMHTVNNSVIENSDLSIGWDHMIIEDAVIIDGVLESGNITWNGTEITGPANLTDIINYVPKANFTYAPENPKAGEKVTFTSTSTDANIPGDLNDSLSCTWGITISPGKSEEKLSFDCVTTYSFEDKGDYQVNLKVTDKFNKSDYIEKIITVKKSSSSSGGSSPSGGSPSSTPTISTITLTEEGVTKILKENDILRFTFENESHTLTLADVGEDKIDIIVQSEPVVSELLIGETAYFRLNNDSENDISVTLVSILENRAKITIKKVIENITEEETEKESEEEIIKEDIEEEEEFIEQGWADYIAKQEKIPVQQKIKSAVLTSLSFCKKTALMSYGFIANVPYLKYVILGIIILAAIIMLIAVFGSRKIGKMMMNLFFEEEKKPKRKR